MNPLHVPAPIKLREEDAPADELVKLASRLGIMLKFDRPALHQTLVKMDSEIVGMVVLLSEAIKLPSVQAIFLTMQSSIKGNVKREEAQGRVAELIAKEIREGRG